MICPIGPTYINFWAQPAVTTQGSQAGYGTAVPWPWRCPSGEGIDLWPAGLVSLWCEVLAAFGRLWLGSVARPGNLVGPHASSKLVGVVWSVVVAAEACRA